jgi:hypothetical protein
MALNIFETYKLIVEDTNQLGSRRQTIDTVYEGIVTLVLGADGYVAATAEFHGWLPLVVTAVIGIIGIIFTVHWRGVVDKLKEVLSLRYEYLRELEKNDELQTVKAQIYTQEWQNIYAKRATKDEKRSPSTTLQSIFIAIFIILPVALGIITVLAMLPATGSFIGTFFPLGK